MSAIELSSEQRQATFHRSAVARLQGETTAIRLHVKWLGNRKALSSEQKILAANVFDADQSTVAAAKILLDTTHPAFRAVSAIKSETVLLWRNRTLPYVEAGVRLIPRQYVMELERMLEEAREKLAQAVFALQECFPELIEQARLKLGDLFDQSDYPADLSEMFAISWDYPSMEVPNYLRQISPEVYRQECDRVQSRFEEAVEIAEQAFAEELRDLVTHLAERLSGHEDGKPKIFRDSALANLLEFFERFQRLNVTSNDSLEELVVHAREVVSGNSANELRNRQDLRTHVACELTKVQESIDGHLADRPRRNILRRSIA